MAINNGTPQTETQENWDFFFQYPKFRQAESPIDSLLIFKEEFEEIATNFPEDRYSSDKALKIARERFKIISENAGKLLKKCSLIEGYDETQKQYLQQKQIEYQKMSENWSAEQNLQLVRAIYSKAPSIVERFCEAYKDLLLRETDGEESLIVPLIKSQAEPLATKLNRKVGFQSRLKTLRSFLIKLVTRMESLDTTELDTFYDIHGCSYAVLEKGTNGINSCYQLANMLCKMLVDSKAELLVPRYVGPTDARIKACYRKYVKDYYMNPKSSKYRALHISAKFTESGQTFYVEFHISTVDDEHMANSKAAHLTYKKKSEIDISKIVDFSNINYDEFKYSYNNTTGEVVVTDYAGFIECKPLTKRKIFRPIGR